LRCADGQVLKQQFPVQLLKEPVPTETFRLFPIHVGIIGRMGEEL
jgi:hypothetical protein